MTFEFVNIIECLEKLKAAGHKAVLAII